jgi:hypothetical protein
MTPRPSCTKGRAALARRGRNELSGHVASRVDVLRAPCIATASVCAAGTQKPELLLVNWSSADCTRDARYFTSALAR